VFLPGDWNEGGRLASRFVVNREVIGQAGENLSLETASIDSIAWGTKWSRQGTRKGSPYHIRSSVQGARKGFQDSCGHPPGCCPCLKCEWATIKARPYGW